MPKLQSFEIHFDNPPAVYYTGNEISGNVTIRLNGTMEMRCVRVRFKGRMETRWTETRTVSEHTGEGVKERTVTDYYRSEETYVHHEVTVFGIQPGASYCSNPYMPGGTHAFPFRFQLPPSCLNSFEGAHGSIRYFVEAEIDRPWKFNHKTKRAFTVLSVVDLNEVQNAGEPYRVSDQTTLGCLCCVAGRIDCQISLPKTGYVPGEIIALTGEVNNNSSRYVGPVIMRLLQNSTYTANCGGSSGCKSIEVALEEVNKGEVLDPGDGQIWNNEGLRVPPVPPTMTGNGLIRIHYVIEFTMVPSGLSRPFIIRLPITIGSVPLRQQFPLLQQSYEQHGSYDSFGMPCVGPGQPIAPFMYTYPELPPPVYAQVAGGKVSIKDDTDNEYTKGEMQFAPRYPYYEWSNAG